MKVPLSLCAMLGFAGIASGVLVGPYANDPHTLHLYNFDEPPASSMTVNAGGAGGAVWSVNASPAAAVPPVITTVLGVPGYAGFGNAANPGVESGALLGYDGNGSGFYEGDVSGLSLSPDRVDLGMLGIGGPNPFTLEAMIFLTSSAGNREIICTDSSAGTRGFQFRVTTGGTTGQRLEFNLIGSSGCQRFGDIPASGPHAFALNTWFHVAFTYDGLDARFYWTVVDPSVAAANPLGDPQAMVISGTAGAIQGPLVFGNENRAAAGENLWGLIDEIRISTVARSATEMRFDPGGLDVVPPVISECPAHVTALCMDAGGAMVDYLPPMATDDRDGVVPVVCTPAPGAWFPMGNTLVTCLANDAAGNTSSCGFYVTVLSAPPEEILVGDTFDVSVPSHDVNFEPMLGRQSGLLAPLDYVELAGTTHGGPTDYQTRLDGSCLVFEPTNPPSALRLATVSPRHDFIEGSEFSIEFDVDPGANDPGNTSTDWAAIILGSTNGNVSVNASGGGVGILFRNNGNLQVYDGSTPVYDGHGDFPGGHLPYGRFHVRIDVSADAFDGSPALVAARVDGIPIRLSPTGPMTFLKTNGFAANWITLAGFGNTNWLHLFDNLTVMARGRIAAEPAAVACYRTQADQSVTVTVPASVLATRSVDVVVSTADASVAEPQGAVAGSLVLHYPMGGPNEQTFAVVARSLGGTVFSLASPDGVRVATGVIPVSVTNLPPTITCPPDLALECFVDVPPPDFQGGSVTSLDPAPVVSHVGDVISGTLPMVITRTYQVTDAVGDTATCDQAIAVQDMQAPSMTCPPPVLTLQADDATCQAALPDLRPPDLADNCGDVTLTQTPAAGALVGVGITTVTLQAVDSANNEATCTVQVDVVASPVSVSLSIKREAARPVVSWPVTCSPWCLLEAEHVGPNPVAWQFNADPVEQHEGRWRISVAVEGSRFYRLVEAVPRIGNIRFGQLDWHDEDNVLQVPNSSWGVFSADVVPHPTEVVYLNVMADAGHGPAWIIQNLPVFPRVLGNGALRQGCDFDITQLGLTEGMDLGSVTYWSSLDSSLQTAPPSTSSMPSVAVVDDVGRNCGGGKLPSDPLGDSAGQPAGIMLQVVPTNVIQHVGIESVQETNNACLAGALARAIRLLAKKHSLTNSAGTNKTAQGIYTDLRGLKIGSSGTNATTYEQDVAAKAKYLKDLAAANGKTGSTKILDKDNLVGPVTGVTEETAPDPVEWIKKELAKGAVELHYDKHIVTVTGYYESGGKIYIKYRDDETQGDDKKGDSEEKTAEIKKDGTTWAFRAQGGGSFHKIRVVIAESVT